MIERFDREKFYSVYDGFPEHLTVELNVKEGRDLATQYLSGKYRFDVFEYQDFLDVNSCRAFIKQALSSCGEKINYRCCGIFVGSGHAVPLTYIREGGTSAILHNDSIGAPNNASIPHLLAITFPSLQIYSIIQGRQKDLVSCYTDALIIAKNTCGRKIGSNEFLIQNLLSFLNSHSSYSDSMGFFYVSKLPCRLLQTSQAYTFITRYHQEQCSARDQKHNLEFLRLKGIRLAHKIEIDFYRAQLIQYAPEDEVDNIFVAEAKALTKHCISLIPLHESANRFLIDQINLRDSFGASSTAQKIACGYVSLVLIQASICAGAYLALNQC